MLCFSEGRARHWRKGQWVAITKTVVFLPNAAQCDTPSIPSQNNCSLRDEVSPPPAESCLHTGLLSSKSAAKDPHQYEQLTGDVKE